MLRIPWTVDLARVPTPGLLLRRSARKGPDLGARASGGKPTNKDRRGKGRIRRQCLPLRAGHALRSGRPCCASRPPLPEIATAHSSGSPALRRPSNKTGRFGARAISHFTVSWGLRRWASARSNFPSSLLPSSA